MDLRRSDGLSNRNNENNVVGNKGNGVDDGIEKDRKKGKDKRNSMSGNNDESDDDLDLIIEGEKEISDAAYRAGNQNMKKLILHTCMISFLLKIFSYSRMNECHFDMNIIKFK